MKFKDIKGARKWLLEWYDMGQQFHQGKYKDMIMSMRCMSGHVSLALCPQTDDEITSSFQTKYGPELYQFWQESLEAAS
ncbi:hypothetical protein [Vibrio harveyi]